MDYFLRLISLVNKLELLSVLLYDIIRTLSITRHTALHSK